MISPENCLGCQVARGIAIPESDFVYADEFWTVNHMLAPAPLLGWLILQPRRHIEALHEMSSDEQLRMAQLMTYLDSMLRSLITPSKVYVCLFAEAAHCPHIHFHIIPRAPEIEARGPEIFLYKPETYPSEEDIANFVRLAQAHLKSLIENAAKQA